MKKNRKFINVTDYVHSNNSNGDFSGLYFIQYYNHERNITTMVFDFKYFRFCIYDDITSNIVICVDLWWRWKIRRMEGKPVKPTLVLTLLEAKGLASPVT